MAIKKKTGLGRGLSSLIPQSDEPTKTVAIGVAQKVTPTNTDDTESSAVSEINLDKISANPDQPRTSFGHQGMEDLAASIREHGIIQPLALSPKSDGSYEIIAGERRFRAAQLAGLKSVPAVIRQADSRDKLVLALIENIQREDLNPVEEAKAYQRLIDEFNLTQEELAKRVGKNRSVIANSLRLLSLPEVIRKALMSGQITVGHAKALLSFDSEEKQLQEFEKIK